jgi:hypothetical protein
MESGIDGEQLPEAPHQQSGTDQQDERYGDFVDHERCPQPPAPGAISTIAPAFFQRRVRLTTGHMKPGRQSKEQAGDYGQSSSKRETCSIDPCRAEARCRGRQVGYQRARGPERHEQTGRATQHGQDDALCEQLSSQTAPGGPYRRTDCEFPCAAAGSRQQQIRHIGACRQKHECNDRHEDEERGSDVTDELFPHGDQSREGGLVRSRPLHLDGSRDRVELSICLVT